MTKSMVNGNPMKHILLFALPLLLGNLFQQTYNMVDAAIVGQTLGNNALAALGSTSSVQFLVLGFCMGICMGFGIPVAQSFGGEKYDEMRLNMFNGILLSIFFSIILVIATCLGCDGILNILKVPSEIYSDARNYIMVIFIGIPFTILYNFLASILRSIGDSKTPFMFLAFSACLNIVLDYVCIVYFHWGVAGAAIATVFSQGLSGVLCILLIMKKFEILHLKKSDMHYDGHEIKRLMIMGIPMGLQYSITAIGSMVMQSANNSLGTIYVSGFTAGVKIKQFIICPFDALAASISTFISQNYGAEKYHRIKEGMQDGFVVVLVYSVIAATILIFGGRTLSKLFVMLCEDNADLVLDASALYLRRMAYCWWVLGMLTLFRNGIQALGFAPQAVLAGAFEMVARILISIIFVPIFGFNAITWADQVAWTCATIYVVIMFIILYRGVMNHKYNR